MRDALNVTGRRIFYSLCGVYANPLAFFRIFFEIFLPKVVLMYMIFGHRVSEIVGEQQTIFKIIGLQ
jgi:hypothetical protein